MLLTHHPSDDHPDHEATGRLTKAAWFLALTAVGAPVFLILVLILAARARPGEQRSA